MLANRVRETTTTTGLSDFTLAGAVSGWQAFGDAFGAEVVFYTCYHSSANEWEVGYGLLSGSTLARTTILASSNSGSKVTFSAGTKSIFNALPAEFFQTAAAAGRVPLADSAGHIAADWLKPTIGVDYLYTLSDGATVSVDLDLAGKFIVTIAGNRTLTFDNADSNNVFWLSIKQDGTGGRTVTWPTVTWQTNHSLNPTADSITSFVIAKVGSTYYGWRVDTRSNAFYTCTNSIDAENGLNQKRTLTANSTFTLANLRDGETLTLLVVQGGTGSYTVTWFTVSWPSAAAPTLATAVGQADLITITRVGSTYIGKLVAANVLA